MSSSIRRNAFKNAWKWKCRSLSRVRLSATPWTVTLQAPLSMEFSRQDTGVGGHALLQGIFPTQRLKLGLLHRRQILYRLNHQGSPKNACACLLSHFSHAWLCATLWTIVCQASVHEIFQARILERVAMPFSRGSSRPRDCTHVSCGSSIAGGFFTTEPPEGPKYAYENAKLSWRVIQKEAYTTVKDIRSNAQSRGHTEHATFLSLLCRCWVAQSCPALFDPMDCSHL